MQTTPALEDLVFDLLVVLGRRLRRLPGDRLDIGLVPVLATLDAQGPSRQGSLACALGLDASTISRHIRQLEERELVLRTEDPEDGRASLVSLTDHGAAELAEHRSRRRALIAGYVDGWSPEDRATLHALTERLANELDDDSSLAPSSRNHP